MVLTQICEDIYHDLYFVVLEEISITCFIDIFTIEEKATCRYIMLSLEINMSQVIDCCILFYFRFNTVFYSFIMYR